MKNSGAIDIPTCDEKNLTTPHPPGDPLGQTGAPGRIEIAFPFQDWCAIRVRGLSMIKINAHFFFKAGEDLGRLRTLSHSSDDLLSAVLTAIMRISALLDKKSPVALEISRDTAVLLQESLKSFFDEVSRGSSEPDLRHRLELFQRFDHELAAELGKRDTYALSQRGLYDTSKLVRQASGIFGASIRSALSEDNLRDFDEAGRCLAFEVPTACGFHLMRGVEAVLRQWYDLTPIARKDPEPRFHQCLDQLTKHFPKDKKGNIEDRSVRSTIAALDQIRELYRNAIAHPDFFLEDADEAERWFRIAVTAVEQMAPHIAKAKSGP